MLELYTESRNLFEKYAGFAGDVSTLEGLESRVHGIQILLARWQHKNFPKVNNGDCQFALGIAEEVGELCEAETPEKINDARGDISIFMAQLLTLNRLSIAPLLIAARELVATGQDATAIACGRVCHAVLKHHQGIRGMEESAAYREVLVDTCTRLLASAACDPSIFIETAGTVLLRDWTKQ